MKIRDGVLISINKSKDIKHGTCIIPNNVTRIGCAAFIYCKKLINVIIPNSVTSIGSNAFEGCTHLTSIEIPDSVKHIGGSAFFGCTSLTNVIIGNGVTRIGYGAFMYCKSLTRVTTPKVDKIRCVKGFYRKGEKLWCHYFIYEIGKTYKEDAAVLCSKGFHACTLGLDVFNYYSAYEGTAFYEVELSGLSPETRGDSKICGTTITLLRELTVAEAANYKTKIVE